MLNYEHKHRLPTSFDCFCLNQLPGRSQHRKQREPGPFDNLSEFEKQDFMETAEATEDLQEQLKSTSKARMTQAERLRYFAHAVKVCLF